MTYFQDERLASFAQNETELHRFYRRNVQRRYSYDIRHQIKRKAPEVDYGIEHYNTINTF